MSADDLPKSSRGSGLLTLEEAAAYLAVEVGYLRRLLREGRLPYTKPFGRYVRVARADLDAAIEAGRVEAWR